MNRKIANTSFGCDVADILAQFPLPTLSATLTQRVNYPEAAAGKAVFELDPNGPAQAEVAALIDEMLAMLDEVPA